MNARWIILSVVGLSCGSVFAQEKVVTGESPRANALEFKLGGFKPFVDREAALGDAKPFESTFGASALILGELEYNRQLWQEFGSIAVGFSIGYAEKFGRARLAETTGGDPIAEPVAEITGFRTVPMKLLAVYRFDYAALNWGIPVVPYVKGGLAYSAWWVTKGTGVEFDEGVRGAGGKWGYSGIAGISLLLDFFDRRLARDFDTGMGVNHSYLFAEYVYSDVNDFGGGGLDLSSRYWMFGLTLEY